MLVEKTIICPYCGKETSFTDMCDGCYLVRNHIDGFLKSEKGRKFIKNKLKSLKN